MIDGAALVIERVLYVLSEEVFKKCILKKVASDSEIITRKSLSVVWNDALLRSLLNGFGDIAILRANKYGITHVVGMCEQYWEPDSRWCIKTSNWIKKAGKIWCYWPKSVTWLLPHCADVLVGRWVWVLGNACQSYKYIFSDPVTMKHEEYELIFCNDYLSHTKIITRIINSNMVLEY